MTRARARAAALVATLAVLASGCGASVTSHVVVTAVDVAEAHLEVLFTGDAAVALSRDGQLDALVDTFETRTGVTPRIHRRGDVLGVVADVTYTQIVDVSDVTGLGGLSLAPNADGTTTLTATFVAPSDLEQALRDALAHDTSEASFAAMAGSTHLVTVIEMPGGVYQAVVSGQVPTEVDDTTVTVDQRLDQFAAGTVTVTGTPGRPSSAATTVAVSAGMAAAGLGLAVVMRRRRASAAAVR